MVLSNDSDSDCTLIILTFSSDKQLICLLQKNEARVLFLCLKSDDSLVSEGDLMCQDLHIGVIGLSLQLRPRVSLGTSALSVLLLHA